MHIEEFVHDLALQAGLQVSKVTIVEGKILGYVNNYLIHIASSNHIVSALVFEHDLENLQVGQPSVNLKLRIRNAISRLKILLEP
jgi:hypothetical protein